MLRLPFPGLPVIRRTPALLLPAMLSATLVLSGCESSEDRGERYYKSGMQLLADRGLEFGVTPGLGWIGGEVRRLMPDDPAAKVPHMGWNTVLGAHPLLSGLGSEPHMYFTHSFAFHPDDPADIVAWTDHGGRFAAVVARGPVMGVQFHPEKSQGLGQKLLSNFLEFRP